MIQKTWLVLLAFTSPDECADFIEKYQANLLGPSQCVIQYDETPIPNIKPPIRPKEGNQ